MKRLLIIIALILISIFGYVVVANGFSNDGMNINISSYTQLGQKSEELTKDVAAYNKKNDEEYSSSLSKLNTAKKQYTLAKEEYQKKIDEYGNLLQADSNYLKNKYRIDFLQTRIGGYAAENGIGLTIVRSNSETPDPNAATWGYVLCNLNFMVSGEYINIANFLYDIENDDQLQFEIRNYSMSEGLTVEGNKTDIGETASFTVYDVPIESSTLIEEDTAASDGNNTSTDNMTSTNTTNTTTNTVSNSTSNSTSNTVSNTTSTNTVANNTTN